MHVWIEAVEAIKQRWISILNHEFQTNIFVSKNLPVKMKLYLTSNISKTCPGAAYKEKDDDKVDGRFRLCNMKINVLDRQDVTAGCWRLRRNEFLLPVVNFKSKQQSICSTFSIKLSKPATYCKISIHETCWKYGEVQPCCVTNATRKTMNRETNFDNPDYASPTILLLRDKDTRYDPQIHFHVPSCLPLPSPHPLKFNIGVRIPPNFFAESIISKLGNFIILIKHISKKIRWCCGNHKDC